MFDVQHRIALTAICLLSCLALNHAASAQESTQGGAWQVSKSSGDVWISSAAVQKAALTSGSSLAVGDNISTGPNGRVLLTRGAETILISPNSSIGIPEKKGELSTTITQRAGTILLEVEKRNVKHFEVETPYLAAVVKGTQFSVSVDRTGTKVNVLRGQVQVADFKSGQYALVLPGQNARVAANGSSGLHLSGSGKLNPILRGTPRAPGVTPLSTTRAAPGRRPFDQPPNVTERQRKPHANFFSARRGQARRPPRHSRARTRSQRRQRRVTRHNVGVRRQQARKWCRQIVFRRQQWQRQELRELRGRQQQWKRKRQRKRKREWPPRTATEMATVTRTPPGMGIAAVTETAMGTAKAKARASTSRCR